MITDRPHPPDLAGLSDITMATGAQRMSCLDWSIRWTRTEGIAPQDLLAMFDRMIDGHPRPRKMIGASALDAAIRALRAAVHRNRMQRTKRALPRAVLNRGPQDVVCAAAERRIGMVVSVDEVSALPLPDCNQGACMCWYRQLVR